MILDWFLRNRLVLWSLSGLSFFLVWATDVTWPLVFVGLILLFWATEVARTYLEVLFGALFVGTLKFAGGSLWLLSTYPLVWMDWDPGVLQVFSLLIYWFFISLVFSLGLGVVQLTWRFAYISLSKHFLYTLPLFFVASEILGSMLFSVVSLGPGSQMGINLSFGYIGYSVAHLAILYPVVKLAGVFGLGLFVSILSTLLFLLLKPDIVSRKKVYTTITIAILFVVVLYIKFPPVELEFSGQKVIAVDTEFTSSMLQSDLGPTLKSNEIIDALVQASYYNPDLLLLPEDSRFTRNFISSGDALEALLNNLDSQMILIDTATVVSSNGETVLRAFYYDLAKEKVYMTDKQHLTPQGEYVPYLVSWFLAGIGATDFLSKLNYDQNYRIGDLQGYEEFDENIPGIIFCFESVVPLSIRSQNELSGSNLILHPVSHAWFHQNDVLVKQLDSMLRVQSIWNEVTIVSAANMAKSKAYYPNGVIIEGREIQVSKYWRLVEYNF